MAFNPSKYNKGEIKHENCEHEILLGNGIEKGTNGFTFECIICGDKLKYFNLDDNLYSKFVKYDYNIITPNIKGVMKNVLNIISLNNDNKNYIDIIQIFTKLEPYIDKCVERNLANFVDVNFQPKVLKFTQKRIN